MVEILLQDLHLKVYPNTTDKEEYVKYLLYYIIKLFITGHQTLKKRACKVFFLSVCSGAERQTFLDLCDSAHAHLTSNMWTPRAAIDLDNLLSLLIPYTSYNRPRIHSHELVCNRETTKTH